MTNPKLDSVEGLTRFADFMRAHRYVAFESHERLAKKHGVDFTGIIVARPIPLALATAA